MNLKSELRFWHLLPALIWFVFMGVLFFLPGDDVPSSGWYGLPHFDKLVHFGLFFVLVSLFCIPVLRSSIPAKNQFLIIVSFIILSIGWGLIVELIQDHFISGRTYDLRDWIADSAGVIFAAVMLKPVGRIFRILV